MLDRLRGEHDPIALLRSVPAIGKTLARRLHEGLGIDSLSDLQAAPYDGRLETFPGLGPKRLTGIRDSLAQRLGRIRKPVTVPFPGTHPPVEELLDVDREFLAAATAGTLPPIHRRNPGLFADDPPPLLHTSRGPRHYTALFSSTPRAHCLGNPGTPSIGERPQKSQAVHNNLPPGRCGRGRRKAASGAIGCVRSPATRRARLLARAISGTCQLPLPLLPSARTVNPAPNKTQTVQRAK